MSSVVEAKERVDSLIPVVEAFKRSHLPAPAATTPWQTRGLRRFDSSRFTVIPEAVRLGEVPFGDDLELTSSDEPLSLLFSSLLRAADYYDKEGRRLLIKSLITPSGDEIPVKAIESRKLHETSQTALLFDASDCRFGVTADLVRLVRFFRIKPEEYSNDQINSLGNTTDYSEALAWLFSSAAWNLEAVLTNGNLKFPDSMRFMHQKKHVKVERFKNTANLDEAILSVLRFVGYPETDGNGEITGVRFRDLEMFRTEVGSLQRNETPWTFGCDARCLFCYTDFGLGAVRYPGRWDRSQKEIDVYAQYYDSETHTGLPMPIFSMQDWEPTRHQNFLGIIKTIVTKAPREPIFIATHGGLLTEKLVAELAKFPQLTLQISLNSASVKNRQIVMRPQNAQVGIDSLKLCRKYGVKFDVSIVATPQWTGSRDMIDTVKFADDAGADYIRIALPTATKDHHPDLYLSDEQLAAIDNLAKALRDEVETPIIITVALLNESKLEAKIEGVIKQSVARKFGLRHGDIITRVNGRQVRSRTECNEFLIAGRNQAEMTLEIIRGNQSMEVKLSARDELDRLVSIGVLGRGQKELGPWGILIPDDVDFGIFQKMSQICRLNGYQQPLMLTSRVMRPFLDQALGLLTSGEEVQNLSIRIAPNEHFGGNVVIAGLQTASDHIKAIEEHINQTGTIPDCVFLPANSYSPAGIDVTGATVKTIENHFGVPAFLIKAKTGSY